MNDSGVDYAHPDLYLNVWINQTEIPRDVQRVLQDRDGDGLITFWDLNAPVNQGPGKISDLNGSGFIDGGDLIRAVSQGGWADGRDDGHNGFIDDLIGWDFFHNDNDPMDGFGHGTVVAGIIGAVGNNGVGVVGVNWKTQIMPVKMYSDDGIFNLSAISPAVTYASSNGARISNNSYGVRADLAPPGLIAEARSAIEETGTKGHLFVAGSGNDSIDNDVTPRFPCCIDLPNIIAVAATDKRDRLAKFTGFGATTVDLGAPGVKIWSTVRGGDYGFESGTSFANPHVVGTAALILARNPNLSYAEVKALILDNVDPRPDLSGKTLTGGRLNVFKAVNAAPLPLLASRIANVARGPSLSSGQIMPLLTQALARWHEPGLDLVRIHHLRVADRSGATLGKALGHTIWLDSNAAGWGWYIDATPWDDAEFTTPGDQGEQNGMDLLTVLAHEIGHLLGYDHSEDGVMDDTLDTSIRTMPAAGTAVTEPAVVDSILALDWIGQHHRNRDDVLESLGGWIGRSNRAGLARGNTLRR